MIGLCVASLLVFVGGCRPSNQRHVDSDPGEASRKPSDWHWLQRTYPHYDFDPVAVQSALSERLLQVGSNKNAASWQQVGPTNVGGRIVDIAFNPKNPQTIYLAAATGGVFKSTDGGANWVPVFDDQAVLTIGDIELDPERPDTIYVGTGEANGGHNNSPGLGVYRSLDGGMTWESVGLAETASIGRIVVDPSRPNRVLTAAVGSYFQPNNERGVYRSIDSGQTWERTLFVNDSTGAIDLVFNPNSPDTVFAATWERVRRPTGPVRLHGNGSGVWRSVDNGVTWTKLGNGLPDPTILQDQTGRARFGRIGLAISESQPQTLYALYVDGVTQGYLGLYRSDNGGDSWYNADPLKGAEDAFANFSWYFGQVRVDPGDPDVVFVLDQQLAMSTNGGASWEVQPGTHVDHHALEYSPDGSVILSGNDGGLARSTDNGNFWTRQGELPITQFYEIAFDPSDPRRLFGGTQDNGTLRSPTGTDGPWTRILGGDGFYVAVDPTNPGIIYAESQNGGLYRLDSDGQTFIKPAAASATNWSTPFILDPDDPSTLLFGARRIFRSTNRGETWTAISPTLGKNATGRLGTVTTIDISPINTDIVFAGTDDGNVWVSSDGGDSWTLRAAGLIDRWVTRVVASPHSATEVFVSFSGLKWRDPQPHVFRSNDLGATWVAASGGLPDSPVNALTADPRVPGLLFTGLDIGAYFSTDSGSSWSMLGSGLPAVAVYDLKVDVASNRLLAGTHGRSMWSLPLADFVTSTQDTRAPDHVQVSAYPNPFSADLTIELSTPAPELEVAVLDVTGRRIRHLGIVRGGTLGKRLRWDGTNDAGQPVASGTYLVVATWDDSGSRRTTSSLVTRIAQR